MSEAGLAERKGRWYDPPIMTRAPLYLLLACTALVPMEAATVTAEPFPPARFTSLYIERDENGTSTAIQLDGDAVIFKSANGKDVQAVTAHPSDDDWLAFIKGLNDAKVYAWAPQYYYPGQGETWVIDLSMDDRKLVSGGTNEYPLAGNESQPQANPKSGPSVPFQVFWQAVLKLAGKAPAK